MKNILNKILFTLIIVVGLQGVSMAGPPLPFIPYDPTAASITGGSIDGVTTGETTPGRGYFTTLKGTNDEVIAASSGNLSASDLKNNIVNNYGQGAANNLQQLPTAAEGMAFLAICGTAQAANYFRIKAATNDKIYLDGTAGSDNGYVSIAAPVVGAVIVFYTFKTGESTYDWYASTVSGAWAAGGP